MRNLSPGNRNHGVQHLPGSHTLSAVRNCETTGPRQTSGPRLTNENKTPTCGGDGGGALGGTRTPNLLIRSQMLYPLSYERLMATLVYDTHDGRWPGCARPV